MPANRKYLSPPGQRALKITAGLIGGYCLAISFHLALSIVLPYRKEVFLTGSYSIFILWTALMVIAFLVRSGWLAWAVYLALTLAFTAVFYCFR